MADDNEDYQQQAAALKNEIGNALSNNNLDVAMSDDNSLEILEHLWLLWGDFSLAVTWPSLLPIEPPLTHLPQINKDTGEVENVLPILDKGYELMCSRAGDGFDSGRCLRKYFNTIDKMVALLIERLSTGGFDPSEEIRVIFSGHELAQRKAFESILNLEENVLVVNYDPGEWGERYMKNVLELVERGYGLPKSSPKRSFR